MNLSAPAFETTGEPLEADAAFRDRLRTAIPSLRGDVLEPAGGATLDALGWLHGMIRGGLRPPATLSR